MTTIKCDHCGGTHNSSEEVKECWLLRTKKRLPRKTVVSSSIKPKIIKLPPTPSNTGSGMTKEEKESRAKHRRKNPSAAEKALESGLERLQNDGYAFSREKYIHGFYADFCFAGGRLVVEVDGSLHDGRELEDARKDQVLEANHYKVLRYSASQVLFHTEDVVRDIERWLIRRKAKPKKIKKQSSSKKTKDAAPKDTFSNYGIDSDATYVTSDLKLIKVPKNSSQVKKVTKTPRVKKATRAPRVISRPMGEYVCLNCPHRKPFIYEEGSPKCFECGKSNQTKPVCRSCAKPFEFWIGQRSWKCQECVDIHSIAYEAASGQRSDITPISEKNKGHKI